MTVQTINIGTAPNDRTGDPLRTAFTKINDNFNYLNTQDSNLSIVARTGQYNDLLGKPAHVDVARLKSIVLASSDFTDFQNRILNDL